MASPITLYQNGERCERSVLRGDHVGLGVFESFRMRRWRGNVYCPGFSFHLMRLMKSVGELGLLACSPQEIMTVIADHLDSSEEDVDVWIRIKCLSSLWEVECSPFKQMFSLEEGISALPFEAERPFPQWKHFSAMVSVMARRVANAGGADEALLVDRDGFVREGAWSNVFAVDCDGILRTPGSRVLPGVTRLLIMEMAPQVEVVSDELPLSWLLRDAKEVFITHASHGIVPVTIIDGSVVGSGLPGPLTRRLQQWYEAFALSKASLWPARFESVVPPQTVPIEAGVSAMSRR